MEHITYKKVALVHDFLVAYGGAERVFEIIGEMFPDAPIYTLLYDAKTMAGHFEKRVIHTSWLSRLPAILKKHYRWFLPFFPVAVESFDLRDFDLVISSSGAWSKGIVTRLNTKHIAYIHSPMRYVWDYHEQYLQEITHSSDKKKGKAHIFTRALLSYLRVWDKQAAERPDVLLTNSHFTQARIRKYYHRESVVVYPPAQQLAVSAQSFHHTIPDRKHFLVVSRLTRSKKILYIL